MSDQFYYRNAQLLAMVNALFWIGLAIFYMINNNGKDTIFALLMFLLGFFYVIALFGLIKKIKLIYLFSLFICFATMLLSITDEFGLFDFLSLSLSSLLFACLLLVRGKFYDQYEPPEIDTS